MGGRRRVDREVIRHERPTLTFTRHAQNDARHRKFVDVGRLARLRAKSSGAKRLQHSHEIADPSSYCSLARGGVYSEPTIPTLVECPGDGAGYHHQMQHYTTTNFRYGSFAYPSLPKSQDGLLPLNNGARPPQREVHFSSVYDSGRLRKGWTRRGNVSCKTQEHYEAAAPRVFSSTLCYGR
ncbi:hypothetical protein FOZ61_007452 [Perkinsus olseni]|uniref:Uncharacterized protein n=1 Tax=Perkinsus olseni TaxID=32597 RepID=A0A7J6L901_PEROL|nr:hypothetical protein FOZ61_007452 [Perkinsus olseni]